MKKLFLLCCCFFCLYNPILATSPKPTSHLVLFMLIKKNNVDHALFKSEGFAVTNSNDTLSGYFSFKNLTSKQYIYFNPKRTRPGDSTDTVLAMGTIRSIYLKSLTEQKPYIPNVITYDYLPSFQRMFRKLYTGQYDFYDENFCTQHATIVYGDIHVVKDGHAFLLDSLNQLFNKNMFKTNFRLLVDFYNTQYATHEKYAHFKNSWDVLEQLEKGR